MPIHCSRTKLVFSTSLVRLSIFALTSESIELCMCPKNYKPGVWLPSLIGNRHKQEAYYNALWNIGFQVILKRPFTFTLPLSKRHLSCLKSQRTVFSIIHYRFLDFNIDIIKHFICHMIKKVDCKPLLVPIFVSVKQALLASGYLFICK